MNNNEMLNKLGRFCVMIDKTSSDPYKRLMGAVILQSVKDARCSDKTIKTNALNWINSDDTETVFSLGWILSHILSEHTNIKFILRSIQEFAKNGHTN